jgi:hypothetical protein
MDNSKMQTKGNVRRNVDIGKFRSSNNKLSALFGLFARFAPAVAAVENTAFKRNQIGSVTCSSSSSQAALVATQRLIATTAVLERSKDAVRNFFDSPGCPPDPGNAGHFHFPYCY